MLLLGRGQGCRCHGLYLLGYGTVLKASPQAGHMSQNGHNLSLSLSLSRPQILSCLLAGLSLSLVLCLHHTARWLYFRYQGQLFPTFQGVVSLPLFALLCFGVKTTGDPAARAVAHPLHHFVGGAQLCSGSSGPNVCLVPSPPWCKYTNKCGLGTA